LLLEAREWAGGIDIYVEFYFAVLSGIFLYLCVTALIAIIYVFTQAPHTGEGIVADIWSVLSPGALGFRRALLILTPGLFVCAGIWSRRIGYPFDRVKGYLQALVCAALLVPASLAAVVLVLSQLFR